MLTSIPPTLRRSVAAVATAGLLSAVTGCAPAVRATPPDRPDRHDRHDRPERAGTALALLATLPVKGRAPMTGYDRDRFGPAWLDANRNGCDERNDILARDLTRTREQNCRIVDGTLIDPYTARTIHYGYGDGALVDIDHVVALGNAWATGAARWSVLKRAGLATDPLNLLAVDASANRQKGDGDAATWLPPNKAYRCAYVARQVAVKAKFGLWVTAPERSAIQRVLSQCPDQPVPLDSGAPVEVTHHITDPGDGAYASCDAARAAGAAPLHRGDAGYGPQLDGDGDGVACE